VGPIDKIINFLELEIKVEKPFFGDSTSVETRQPSKYIRALNTHQSNLFR